MMENSEGSDDQLSFVQGAQLEKKELTVELSFETIKILSMGMIRAV